MSARMRELLERSPQLAGEVRGVLVSQAALRRYVAAVEALLVALDASELTRSHEPLLAAIREGVLELHNRTVPLTPQHVYDLMRHSPGLPAPFELWAPLVEAGLRLAEERDSLAEACGALERELAHVDELIGRARFDYVDADTAANAAWRELVARIRRPEADRS